MKLQLTPIVERLRAAGFRQVEGVLEFNRLDAPPRQLPALYVVPVSETGSAAANDQGSDQAVDVVFAIMLVLDGTRRNAAGIAEDIHVEGERVKAALVGWTMPGASRAFSFARAGLSSTSGTNAVWEVRFRTRFRATRKLDIGELAF